MKLTGAKFTLLLMRFFLVLSCAAGTLFAQNVQPPNSTGSSGEGPTPTEKPLWRCALPGGSYQVAVGAITAVSMHEYVVDGAARVTEVNIDTTGVLLARFYVIEPALPEKLGIGQSALNKAQQIAGNLAERAGQDVGKKVVKNYPTSTHARTVEFRLANKEQLTALLASVEESFRLNRNRSFRIE